MYLGLILAFIVAGLTAIKGSVSFGNVIEMILPILLVVEHTVSGNTTPIE